MKTQKTIVLPALALIKEQIFNSHEIEFAKEDLKKMYLHYMCSTEADDANERQSATVSFLAVIKLLSCIDKTQDPSKTVHATFTIK